VFVCLMKRATHNETVRESNRGVSVDAAISVYPYCVSAVTTGPRVAISELQVVVWLDRCMPNWSKPYKDRAATYAELLPFFGSVDQCNKNGDRGKEGDRNPLRDFQEDAHAVIVAQLWLLTCALNGWERSR